GAETPQARVDLVHDRPARQARAVGTRAHPPVHLGRDHDVLATREVLDRPAEKLLARAVGIDVGGIEEIDAAFERALDEGATLLLIEGPGMIAAISHTVAHAAEADARHLEARAAEFHIVHRVPSC